MDHITGALFLWLLYKFLSVTVYPVGRRTKIFFASTENGNITSTVFPGTNSGIVTIAFPACNV